MVKVEQRKNSVPSVFAIFFHPNPKITALGGAEKRFVETLKIFNNKKNLKITVLESAPSLLEKRGINCKKYLVSCSVGEKGWLSTYFNWIFWTIKASIKGFSVVHLAKPKIILAPNNTLPNLFPTILLSFIFHTPLIVIVHHLDNPSLKTENKAKDCSLYSCYRYLGYSRLVSLAKTFAFYLTIFLLKRVEGIIAVSRFTAKNLENNGILSSKIFVSGNAVNLDLIGKVKPYSREKVYDGVFVGRIAKEKGVFDLVKIWKEVVMVKRNAKLLIIGSGLELPFLREEINSFGLEDEVLLYGKCSDFELYRLLKSSKIFIFPSLFEGWGLAVAEALACGLPVVAYDIPALRENFGKCQSVFFTRPKNFKELSLTVLELLNLSRKKLARLGEKSRIFSRKFSWETVAEKDLEALQLFLELSSKN